MNSQEIKALRKELKVTQKEFAKMINASVRTVEDWEQGRRTPDRRYQQEIDKIVLRSY